MIKLFKLFWILVFVVGAALPLFHMNTAEITEQENRTLAKFPKVHKKGKLNESYGKEFESWLGDRFWGRDQLIDTRFQTLYKINGRIENEKVFIGDDGWMFEKSKTVNRPSIERRRKRIERDAKILKAFADKFKDKNIPIYLVLIPDREALYQKYWEKYYKPKPMLNYSKEITKALDTSIITVVDPEQEFKDVLHDSELLFFKDDSHLTSYGVYIILNRLVKTFTLDQYIPMRPIIKKVRKMKKHVAALAANLGFPGKVGIDYTSYLLEYENMPYHEIEKKNFSKVKVDLHGTEGILYRLRKADKPFFEKKFISIGPCYSESIFELLGPLYRRSEWIRTNMGLAYGEEAKKHNVDKIKQLFNLQPDSAVIIITQDSFEYIKEALE